jgi:phosphoribosylformimino-5-aminoimidazole carboxamide ribotide isomerase
MEEASAWLAANRGDLVIGSESLEDGDSLSILRADSRIILSLDFRGDAFQGSNLLIENETLWPERLIVMTLARVGSQAGPDFTRLETILERAGKHKPYAAGGLRGGMDLERLRQLGVAGVLVASALHDGRLCSADLRSPE